MGAEEGSDPQARGTRGRGALRDLLRAIVDCPRPVIAAVNGAAIDTGAMLALVANRVVAADSASFGFPEIDSPSPLAIAILSALGRSGLAHDLVLSGRRIGAADAQGRGLMSAVCPLDELEGAGLAACRALAQKPAAAFSANKHYSRRQLRREIVEACAAAQRLQDEVASSIGSASWMF